MFQISANLIFLMRSGMVGMAAVASSTGCNRSLSQSFQAKERSTAATAVGNNCLKKLATNASKSTTTTNRPVASTGCSASWRNARLG